MITGDEFWKKKITEDMTDYQLSSGKTIHTYQTRRQNLYSRIAETAVKFPKKTALAEETGRSCTYAGMMRQADLLAAYLNQVHHIKGGSRVGILLYNSLEYCLAFLALSRLSAVLVPLPGKFRKQEVEDLIERSRLDLLICHEDYSHWFEGHSREFPVRVLIEGKGYEPWYVNWKGRETCRMILEAVPEAQMEAPCLLMFTSGTTARSKKVLLKQYQVLHAIESYIRILEITPHETGLLATPIYHITGLVAVVGVLLSAGASLYIHKYFNAEKVIEDCRKYHVNFIHASPTVFYMLMEKHDFQELKELKKLVCGSSHMMEEKLRQLHNMLPECAFHTVYGLTETSSPAAVFPEDAGKSSRYGSSGLIIPGVSLKVTDDAGREVPLGTTGMILLKGTNVIENYLDRMPDEQAEGWLNTGDMGYVDQDGYLYVVDRKKDMINRGGEKICSFDVENELVKLPGIKNAAVVGIPHEQYGEAAAAAVVTEAGSSTGERQIQEMLKGKIASYKIPVKIKVVSELPLTPNNKIDKAAVKRLFMEENI